jgi:hypothetical protein
MSDEPTTAPETTDTPSPEADSQPGTPAIPEGFIEADRYKHLQADYTRSQQENAEYRQFVEALQDPETGREALSALDWLELAEPEQPSYDNPYEAELATLKAQLEQQGQQLSQMTQAQQQAAQRAAEQSYFEHEFEGLQDAVGRQLGQQEVNHIIAYAKANPDDQGRPDVKAGWDSLKGLYESNFNETVEAKKRAPKAPAGQPGAAVPDLTTREGRLHAAAEKLAALQDQ